MNRVVFENIEDELKEAEKMKKLKEIMVAAVAAAMVISVPVMHLKMTSFQTAELLNRWKCFRQVN